MRYEKQQRGRPGVLQPGKAEIVGTWMVIAQFQIIFSM
jgi:hypothetical protein